MTRKKAPEGPITCLFTDIEGSTPLSETHPNEWKRVSGEHDRILAECIREAKGHPERPEGDSFFATFRDAASALNCAIAIQEHLNPEGKPCLLVQKENGEAQPVRVQIGVYRVTEAVYLTEQGAYRDHQIALAKRTMDCGVGGMIVVSEEAWKEAHNYVAPKFRAWENRVVRDIPGPVTLYELLWDGDTTRKIRASLWVPDWFRRAEDSFVGREAYLEELEQRLKTGPRLVVLHAEGGAGKTRLALETSRKMDAFFAGRIHGVPLDSVLSGDPEKVTAEQVVSQIAQAARLPQEIVDVPDTAKLIASFQHRYFEEPFLLILDNFESANSEATRALLGELLAELPHLRCLVTCRMEFDVAPYSESVLLHSLAIPTQATDNLEEFEGYRLFLDRANQTNSPPNLSDTASLVRILNYTGGNALCIELVAARTRLPLTTLKKIADGLETSRLALQSTARGNTRAGAKRHASLEACIDWSFQLLPQEEQPLYLRLSVFPGEFTPEAAQEVAGVSEEILIGWIRFHLASATPGGRCFLAPALREFGSLRLPEAEGQPLQDHLIAYYAHLADTNDNLNSSFQRSLLCAEIRNLHAVVRILCDRSSLTESDGRTLIVLGGALWRVPLDGRSENLLQAIQCFQNAFRVYTEANFPRDWATNQICLGIAYADLPGGDRAQNLLQAIQCYQDALRVRTETDFPMDWAMTQNNLGNAYSNLPGGDRAQNLLQAIQCYQDALRVRTETDFPMQWAMTQFNLALAREESGNRTEARLAMEQSVRGYRHVGMLEVARDGEEWLRAHP